MSDIVQLLFNGLGWSAFYALFAIGLTLVFGVMRVINFAHGELFMIGCFTIWVVVETLGNTLPLPLVFLVALLIAMLVVGGLGVALERGLFRPLRKELLAGYMASLGLMYVLQVSAGQIFGYYGRRVPAVFPGNIEFLGAFITHQRVATIIVAAMLVGILWFFLGRTKLGRAMRATSQDSEAAVLQGIGINRMSALVMAIGSALAAAAGVLVSNMMTISAFIGGQVIWKAFIVVIVGGMGSIGGTIVASLLFGFLDSLVVEMGEPQIVIMVDVLVMLLVLAFRPRGILGRGIE